MGKGKYSFITLVDEDNGLGELYGFKAIPNGLLIDEDGILRHKVLSAFDIGRPETRAFLEDWLSSPAPLPRKRFRGEDEASPGPAAALVHFRQGNELKRKGLLEQALASWKKAAALDPDNYLIRKQVWASEHPEKFYDGDVDYDWQDEQLRSGR